MRTLLYRGMRMARFYDVDGLEVDVQDPNFYLEKEVVITIKESIDAYLNDYVY